MGSNNSTDFFHPTPVLFICVSVCVCVFLVNRLLDFSTWES